MDANGGDIGISVLAEAVDANSLNQVSCQLSRSLDGTTWTEVFDVEAEANIGDWTITNSGADYMARCIFDSAELKTYIDFTAETLLWTDFEDADAANAGALTSSQAGTAGAATMNIFDTTSTMCNNAVTMTTTVLAIIFAYLT